MSKTFRPTSLGEYTSEKNQTGSSKKMKTNKKKPKEKTTSQEDKVPGEVPEDEQPSKENEVTEHIQPKERHQELRQKQCQDIDETEQQDGIPEETTPNDENEHQDKSEGNQEQKSEVTLEDDRASQSSMVISKGDKSTTLSRLSKSDKATMKALLRISTLTGGDEKVTQMIETILTEQSKMKTLIMEQAQEIAYQKGRIEELERKSSEERISRTEEQSTGREESLSTDINPKQTYALVVSSGTLHKNEVAALIKRKVDPVTLGLQDATMRNGREGVVVTTSSKEASSKLLTHFEKDKDLKNLTTKLPKENRLQIKVIGIDEDTDLETLPEKAKE
ncbi:uncharacterized protein LOC142563519 [Dermacentor variabilis]|uniref:uncharacterized protein LOC142563519 n=1 Tax=Dermacentor variabilis TaxID=34621 RepID=UPI003F5C2863